MDSKKSHQVDFQVHKGEKNLTLQEKVKEWIQILPPTRTATSEAILIINSDENSNASPAGNLSEAGT